MKTKSSEKQRTGSGLNGLSNGIMLQIESWKQKTLKNYEKEEILSSSFSLVLIRDGMCRIQRKSQIPSLHQGELVILPPNQKFILEGRTVTSCIEIIFLCPTLMAFFLCSMYLSDELETASSDPVLNTDFFEEVKNIFFGDPPDAAVKSSISIFHFFRKLNESSGKFLSDEIFHLVRRINLHPEKDYSRNALKKQYQSSYFTLQRLFRKHLKFSICDYVFQARMNLAEQLSAEKKLPVKEIAEKCGYRNFSFFCQEFKRIHKVTPGEFQRKATLKNLPLTGTAPLPSDRIFRKLLHKNDFCKEQVYVSRDWMPYLNLVFPRVLYYGESEMKAGYFHETITPIWLLMYIQEGTIILTDIQTGEKYKLTPGTLIITEPDLHYRTEVYGKRNARMRYLALNRNILTALMLAYNTDPVFHIFRDHGKETENYFDEISGLLRSRSESDTENAAELTYAFLLSLLNAARQELPGLLNRIMRLIQNSIPLPLKLRELAEKVGCSVPTVNLLFRKHLQTTPAQYIFQMRMIYAEKLLRCQDLSIQDVASCCGFQSFALFSKDFRQYHGCTPYHFRENVFDTEKIHQSHREWFKQSSANTVTLDVTDE